MGFELTTGRLRVRRSTYCIRAPASFFINPDFIVISTSVDLESFNLEYPDTLFDSQRTFFHEFDTVIQRYIESFILHSVINVLCF